LRTYVARIWSAKAKTRWNRSVSKGAVGSAIPAEYSDPCAP